MAANGSHWQPLAANGATEPDRAEPSSMGAFRVLVGPRSQPRAVQRPTQRERTIRAYLLVIRQERRISYRFPRQMRLSWIAEFRYTLIVARTVPQHPIPFRAQSGGRRGRDGGRGRMRRLQGCSQSMARAWPEPGRVQANCEMGEGEGVLILVLRPVGPAGRARQQPASVVFTLGTAGPWLGHGCNGQLAQ